MMSIDTEPASPATVPMARPPVNVMIVGVESAWIKTSDPEEVTDVEAPLTYAVTVSATSLNPTATPAPTPDAANEPWPENESIVAVSDAVTATVDVAVTSAPPEIEALTLLAIRFTETAPPTAKSAAPEPATVMLMIVADSPLITYTEAAVTVAPEIPARWCWRHRWSRSPRRRPPPSGRSPARRPR